MSKKMNLFEQLSEFYPYTPEQLENIITEQVSVKKPIENHGLSIETLRKEHSRGYSTWFERWWTNHDMERSLVNAAKAGYRSFSISAKLMGGE